MRVGKTMLVAFIAPALVLYLAGAVLPALATILISLFEWSGFSEKMTYVGLNNYRYMLADPAFWVSLRNTLLVVGPIGVVVFGLALVFTFALHYVRRRRLARTILFFPAIIPGVVHAIIWGFVYDPEFGLINSTLRRVGLDRLALTWMAPELLFGSIAVALVWINVGFYGTILFAGAEKVTRDYYDAAHVEGASPFQSFRYVTLPMIQDVLGVALVLWAIAAIKTFDFIYAFAGVGAPPPLESWTLGVQMYVVSMGARTPIYRLGYGSAISVVMLALVGIAAMLIRRLAWRERVEF